MWVGGIHQFSCAIATDRAFNNNDNDNDGDADTQIIIRYRYDARTDLSSFSAFCFSHTLLSHWVCFCVSSSPLKPPSLPLSPMFSIHPQSPTHNLVFFSLLLFPLPRLATRLPTWTYGYLVGKYHEEGSETFFASRIIFVPLHVFVGWSKSARVARRYRKFVKNVPGGMSWS